MDNKFNTFSNFFGDLKMFLDFWEEFRQLWSNLFFLHIFWKAEHHYETMNSTKGMRQSLKPENQNFYNNALGWSEQQVQNLAPFVWINDNLHADPCEEKVPKR